MKDKKEITSKQEFNMFAKIPNSLIRTKKDTATKICIVYLISEITGIKGKGNFTAKYLIRASGRKIRRGSDGTNAEFITTIKELINEHFISLNPWFPIITSEITANTEISFISNLQSVQGDFTILTEDEYKRLVLGNYGRAKKNMLKMYLYVKSYYHAFRGYNTALGFCQSVASIGRVLGLSSVSVGEILDKLVRNNFLFKYTPQKININGKIKKLPNIYIPNLGQTETETHDINNSTVTYLRNKVKNQD